MGFFQYSQEPLTSKQSLLSVLIGIFILGIPFIDNQSLIDPKLISRHIYVAAGVGVFALLFLLFSKNLSKKNDFNRIWLLPFCLLSVSYIISSFFAHNTYEAIFWVSKIALYTAFFILLLYLRTYQLINFKIIGFFVALTVTSSILLFYFEVESKELLKTTTLIDKNLYNLSSPFGHKNLFSSFLLLCIPFLIFLFNAKRKSIHISTGLVIVATLMMLLLIQTKSVLLGLLIGISFGVFAVLRHFYKSHKKIVVISLCFLALLMGGMLVVIGVYYEYFSLLFQTDSFMERVLVWSNSISLISDHFLVGVGGGNWQIFFPAYGLNDFYLVNNDIHLAYETFQRPHNDFLWVFGEAGILGFLAFCSIFVFAFIGLTKQLKNTIKKSDKLTILVFLIILISYVVVSLFDFPLERGEHQIMTVLFLSLCVPFKKINPKKITLKKRYYGIVLVIFSVAIFSYSICYLRFQEEQKHLKVLGAHKHGNWSAMIKHSKSIDRKIFALDHFSIPVSWYSGIAYFSLGSLNQALDEFKHAYSEAPYQVHVLNNLAGVYQKTGNTEEAMKYYDEALAISAHHYEVLLNKSIAHYNENQFDESFSTILKLRYKDEHPPLYHQAMKQIFNKKLDLLKQDSISYQPKSINNLQTSDSLKRVFLYEYQMKGKTADTLFNTFIMSF